MNERLGLGIVFLVGVGAATACTSLLGNDFEVGDGGGGQGAGGGSGGTGGSTSCEPGTAICSDATTLVECSESGEPIESQCPTEAPVCAGGACVPCEGTATRCNDPVVEHCEAGQWVSGETCTIGCDEGACLEVVDLGAGVAHTCAVLSNGTVRCWGYDKHDLLFIDGLDDPAEPGSYVMTPTPVPDLDDAVEVAGGDAHSCVRTMTDEVKCWGWNGMGQLGTGDFANADTPAPVALSSTVTSMAVALASNCVALASGDMACWGLNEHGEFGNGEAGSSLTEPTPVEISFGFPVDQVSGTYGHTCARVTVAEAFCFGNNGSGQLGNGTTDDSTTPVGVMGEGVQEIFAGDGHTCGRIGTELACWGSNNNGQLGLGVTGSNVLSETMVTAVGGATRIELSDNFSCVLDGSDQLVCWGRNVEGQMGNGQSGANTWQLTPFTVPIGPVRDVALGYKHGCAVTTDGEVLCWGLNNHGQLGTGDITAQVSPQPVVW
ncbi:MAG: hypothetical protein JRI68_05705 [Deltaproteobacteria bacterium]|nr:hypothetical protein [Deltaproteobacteria bacterium]